MILTRTQRLILTAAAIVLAAALLTTPRVQQTPNGITYNGCPNPRLACSPNLASAALRAFTVLGSTSLLLLAAHNPRRRRTD